MTKVKSWKKWISHLNHHRSWTFLLLPFLSPFSPILAVMSLRWNLWIMTSACPTCTDGRYLRMHRAAQHVPQVQLQAHRAYTQALIHICKHTTNLTLCSVSRYKHFLCLMCEVWWVRGGWELLWCFDQAGAHTWVLHRERVPAQVWYWHFLPLFEL